MGHLINKVNQLKWLRAVGVDYYFVEPTAQPKHLITRPLSPLASYSEFEGDEARKLPARDELRKNSTTQSLNNQFTILPMAQNYSESKIILQEENSIKSKAENAKINSSKNIHEPVSANKKIEASPNSSTALQLARKLADEATSLEELRKSLIEFEGCSLKKLANNTVFADGNPNSSIMLIGEAPGSTEDARGIPFCGESGQLLDNILASINLSREHNAYITNTVFWRPPANRQPTLEEIDICRPFVEKHIALINPKLIVLVGNVAATSLLGKNAGVTKIRQEYYWYTNPYLMKPIQTTAIFHPAYLLRQPAQKKTIWYDLLRIQEFVNININPTNS